jgi:hypothetical protein
MTIPCPNKGHEDYKKLATEVGDDAAHIAFFRNGNEIPTVAQARSLLKTKSPDYSAPSSAALSTTPERANAVDDPRILFQPSDHEDAIEGAAVKMPDGRIFKATIHPEALIKAKEYYEANEEPAKFNHWLELSDWTDGFTTKKGQFLDRQQAMDHAKSIGQLTNKSYAGASKMFSVLDRKQPEGQSVVDQRNLESLRFDHARAFLPNEPEGQTASKPSTGLTVAPFVRPINLRKDRELADLPAVK